MEFSKEKLKETMGGVSRYALGLFFSFLLFSSADTAYQFFTKKPVVATAPAQEEEAAPAMGAARTPASSPPSPGSHLGSPMHSTYEPPARESSRYASNGAEATESTEEISSLGQAAWQSIESAARSLEQMMASPPENNSRNPDKSANSANGANASDSYDGGGGGPFSSNTGTSTSTATETSTDSTTVTAGTWDTSLWDQTTWGD